MASIIISELAGAGLFQDSESFLNELTDGEMSIMGGGKGGNVYFNSEINVNTIGAFTDVDFNSSIKIVVKKGKKK